MKHLYLFFVFLISINCAKADTFLGVFVGVGYWDQSFGGDITTFGTGLSIDGDLGVEDSDGNFLFVALEHPIPFLPNFRVSQVELESTGSSELNQTFTFGDQSFTQGVNANTNLDLSHTEFLLYYEILDNWVNLDLGLAFKLFDGDLQIDAAGISASETLDETLPMLFGRAAFELPFTGWRIDVEGSVVSISGNSIYDLSLEVGYETFIGLGAELGYRTFTVDVDEFDDNLIIDTSFDGIYFTLYYHL